MQIICTDDVLQRVYMKYMQIIRTFYVIYAYKCYMFAYMRAPNHPFFLAI